MKIVASLISALLCLQPALVFAEDDPNPPDIVIFKSAGKLVPFPGVFYSNQAYAEEKAKKEQAQARFDEKLRLELGLQEARLKLATSTTASALKIEKEKSIEINQLKDRQIASLQEQLVEAEEKSHSTLGENILWMIGGASAVAIGGLVVAAVAGAFNHNNVVTSP